MNFEILPTHSVIEIISPGNNDYDEARSIYNCMTGQKPGAIVKIKEVVTRIKASYGDNYKRFQKVKAKYDPDNFFSANLNIKPA